MGFEQSRASFVVIIVAIMLQLEVQGLWPIGCAWNYLWVAQGSILALLVEGVSLPFSSFLQKRIKIKNDTVRMSN